LHFSICSNGSNFFAHFASSSVVNSHDLLFLSALHLSALNDI